jgi:hypothetical protein
MRKLWSIFHVRLHKFVPLGFWVAFLVLKVAVKKANVGGPVKPAVNSILLEIGQVNPHVNAHWRGRYVGFRIKALV